ncbi:MAG TPA: ATP-binding protein, partial [Geobacterales bacterium]|nr:ATP-binding protein [Geobacterales bacterium]
FELFRRVGTQDVKGDGMGLTYVKTLVKRHGGRIWLNSELGVGSTFSFSLSQTNNGQGKATITLQKADQ